MRNRLSDELAEKYKGTPNIRQMSGGNDGDDYWIADLFMQHAMTDEAYLDLIGSIRTRKLKPTDGSPPKSAPDGMQIWVEIDLRDGEVIRWWYVDARIVFTAQNWFKLNEILLLAPSHWPPALKNQYPGAVPSVCLYC